ncbi:MAG: hypothetical protein PHV23_05160 [Candidatus Gracilibacteria bacterium]|nr:hypothetical protein [Candidatus Gracilibacteria bacterium]
MLSSVSAFSDYDYYIGNEHYFLKDINGCSLYDSNNNLLDNISTNNCYSLSYDSGLKKYYIHINTGQELINSKWVYYFDIYYINNNSFNYYTNFIINGSWHDFKFLYNGNFANTSDSYLDSLGYGKLNTFGQGGFLRNVGSKRLYFSGQNIYVSNDTGLANSISFGKDPNYGDINAFPIDDNNFAVLDKNTDGTYKYYIFSDNLGTLQYSSNNITLTGGPTSCNDFSSLDPWIYDDCNMFGFEQFCNMDMYRVCSSNANIKYNTENKIIVENKYDSFSEENTYLQSINSSPNQNIDGYFTDQYVWNSDLPCRVYYKTDGITPSCTGKLIQNGNSLYCNPNLTHLGITYTSSFFSYYTDETTSNYLCGAVYDNSGIQGPPGPPGQDGADGTNGINGTNGVDGINGTNGIDGVDGQDGADGFSCWDTNLNHINDISEDKNNDGYFNTLDCYGSTGANGQNGTDGKDGIDGVNGIDGKNGETIETLSDDTKGFWDGIFDKIGGLFSIGEDKISGLNDTLSGALDTGTSGFSIGNGGFSEIDFTPGNNNYGNIINKNENNKTCDMFNTDGSFAYYSNGSMDLTIDLNGILNLSYADKVPFLEELLFIPNKIFGFVTNPLQNIFSTLRVFGGIGENTYCYFGTLQTIEFQKHIKVGASFFGGELIFVQGTLTTIDYLILFFMGLPLLILTVRILLY